MKNDNLKKNGQFRNVRVEYGFGAVCSDSSKKHDITDMWICQLRHGAFSQCQLYKFSFIIAMWICLLRVTTQCTEPSPNVSCGEDKTKHFLWPLVANTCNQLPQLESGKIIHTVSIIEFCKNITGVRNCADLTICVWKCIRWSLLDWLTQQGRISRWQGK